LILEKVADANVNIKLADVTAPIQNLHFALSSGGIIDTGKVADASANTKVADAPAP